MRVASNKNRAKTRAGNPERNSNKRRTKTKLRCAKICAYFGELPEMQNKKRKNEQQTHKHTSGRDLRGIAAPARSGQGNTRPSRRKGRHHPRRSRRGLQKSRTGIGEGKIDKVDKNFRTPADAVRKHKRRRNGCGNRKLARFAEQLFDAPNFPRNERRPRRGLVYGNRDRLHVRQDKLHRQGGRHEESRLGLFAGQARIRLPED